MPNLPAPPYTPVVELRVSALNPKGLPDVVLRPEWMQWFERVRQLQADAEARLAALEAAP